MNGLLDQNTGFDQYIDPLELQRMRQRIGLLSQQPQAGIPTAQTPGQTGQTDYLGLLSQQPDSKNKWALPLGMGLLNMGAGMVSGPQPLGAPSPWSSGIKGLTQGMMAGMQFQKAEQDELAKKVQAALNFKKLLGEGQTIKVGNKEGYLDPSGRAHFNIGKEGAKTEAERLADEYVSQGMSKEDAIRKAHETIEGGKAAGRPEKLPSHEKLIQDYLEQGLSREEAEAKAKSLGRLEPAEKEQQIILAAAAQRLGKPVDQLTPIEKEDAIRGHKKDIAGAAAEGRLAGESGAVTPGSRLLNAKAWILGTKPMTSFRGNEKAAIADMAYNAGFDTQDLASIQTNYKALATSKTKLANQQAVIEAFTNNAKLNMELGNRISEGVQRFGSPAANAWKQWFQGQVLGQEVPMTQDVRAFQAIVGPTATEWAKVMTSATGAGGVVSDASRKETWDLLNTTLNKSQFKNVGKIMMEELDNRGKGYKMEHRRIDDDVNTISKYVDDKFAAVYPELVKPSSVKKLGGMWSDNKPPSPSGTTKVMGYKGPGKYNGIIIRSQEEFNQKFGGVR